MNPIAESVRKIRCPQNTRDKSALATCLFSALMATSYALLSADSGPHFFAVTAHLMGLVILFQPRLMSKAGILFVLRYNLHFHVVKIFWADLRDDPLLYFGNFHRCRFNCMLRPSVTNRRHIPEEFTTPHFPLRLPVHIAGLADAKSLVTSDVSAEGVRFYSDSEMVVGDSISFTLFLPAVQLGTPRSVLVNCLGRVARCSVRGQRHVIATIIDEYSFERA